MTLSTLLHNTPALLEHSPGSGQSAAPKIHFLLRDTMLLVTTLARDGRVHDPAKLRERCRQLVAHFSSALQEHGYPQDEQIDAIIAQCALLDEAALRHLPTGARAAWEASPLQMERFGLLDAGERVFARIEQRMHEVSPPIDLLECYSAILGIGFAGPYTRDREAQRAALIAALNGRLSKLRPVIPRAFVSAHTAGPIYARLAHARPWAIAGLACLGALIVWLLCTSMLDNQREHAAPAKEART